jgi:hypothetical protein
MVEEGESSLHLSGIQKEYEAENNFPDKPFVFIEKLPFNNSENSEIESLQSDQSYKKQINEIEEEGEIILKEEEGSERELKERGRRKLIFPRGEMAKSAISTFSREGG